MTNSTNILELSFDRNIAAAPAEVYAAWLDPKTPGTPWNEADKLILQPKVDGLFNWIIRGTSHYGRFIAMEPGRRIEHTWMSPYTLGVDSLVTVTFEKRGAGTRMTLVHSGLPDDEKARSHEKGWNYFLDKLVTTLGSAS
jgi:uncharacterized protein YndB with AHSA1/START domain